MKKLIALYIAISTVVAAPLAQAEWAPPGCYVTDSERASIANAFGYMPTCYRAGDNYYNWFTHAEYGRTEMAAFYGSFVEAVMYAGHQDISACSNDYNSILAEKNSLRASYDTLSGQYNGTVAAYNTANASLKSAASREKKLRKACGSKCKRIK